MWIVAAFGVEIEGKKADGESIDYEKITKKKRADSEDRDYQPRLVEDITSCSLFRFMKWGCNT